MRTEYSYRKSDDGKFVITFEGMDMAQVMENEDAAQKEVVRLNSIEEGWGWGFDQFPNDRSDKAFQDMKKKKD